MLMLPSAKTKCVARYAAFAQGLEATGTHGGANTHAWVPSPFSRSINLGRSTRTNGRHQNRRHQHRILHLRTLCAALSATFAQGLEKMVFGKKGLKCFQCFRMLMQRCFASNMGKVILILGVGGGEAGVGGAGTP